jgi:3'-phosphoadenosine 5'-phosphosulfate sulfotransferase (PAPS reductase)/FAD synthetase
MSVEAWQLKQRQSLPLEAKIDMTQLRIKDWYEYWNGQVYVSFSGGKDSTVLLHLVRELYPEVPAVFSDTGLEYPEVRRFVEQTNEVTTVRPKISFSEVVSQYGYPIISKEQARYIEEYRTTRSDKLRDIRWNGSLRISGLIAGKINEKWKYLIAAPFLISRHCCDIMKKRPLAQYEKLTKRVPYIGNMVEEANSRKQDYLRFGCNAFKTKRPISRPLSFWLESDIWDYLHQFNIPYSPIYDLGYTRTGCMFCMFGVHLEKEPNRFQRMYVTHPKQWKYCMDALGLREVLAYIHVPCEPREEQIRMIL